MAGPDLTTDFNATNLFSGLFRLFTGGPSAPAADSGDSLFMGIKNFLKFLFSSFGSEESAPAAAPAAAPPAPAPAPVRAPASTTSTRTVMGTIRDAFSAATESVRDFFRPSAFDPSKAVNRLLSSCHAKPTGQCLGSVSRALSAAGLDFDGRTLGQVMPVRGGTHYAKDLAPILAADDRFDTVASGRGAVFNGGYAPQVGDIAVWTGAKYGHTQMFAGFDRQGQQVWVSDYKTSPHNWTGLRDPNSHGQFQIFRQKSTDDVAQTITPTPGTGALKI